MRTEDEVNLFISELDVDDNKMPAMTYEQGIEAGLMFALGEVDRGDIIYDN